MEDGRHPPEAAEHPQRRDGEEEEGRALGRRGRHPKECFKKQNEPSSQRSVLFEAAAKSDPWSVANAGQGHLLGAAGSVDERVSPAAGAAGGEGEDSTSIRDNARMSDREKRLAALERRGL